MLKIERTIEGGRRQIAQWRLAGAKIALVPTMGALHQGHLALIKAARDYASHVVVSIFVNPTQFGPQEDFNRYPRQEAEDLIKLTEIGTDLAYLPTVGELYPPGNVTRIALSGLADGLCGPFRPGHFSGVATIVTKLFCQIQPDVALFGEKDFQQLQIIRSLTQDLDLPVKVVGVATWRDEDGLALSSRNAYLSPQERRIAPMLYTRLRILANQLIAAAKSSTKPAEINPTEPAKQEEKAISPPVMHTAYFAKAKAALLADGFSRIDYLSLCTAKNLNPVAEITPQILQESRLFAALWLGQTRLIDNIPILP
jgi:pantoate--beta-alanine ligase